MYKHQKYKPFYIFTVILLCLSLVSTPFQSIAHAAEIGISEDDNLTEDSINELGVEENTVIPDPEPIEERDENTEQIIEEDEEEIDYSDFNVEIDEVTITKNSITITWSTNHDIVDEFEIYLDGENVTIVPGDTKNYTFENLNAKEEYYFELAARTKDDNYYYAYGDATPDWSKEELVPVSLITIFNADPEYYNDRIRIRGLDEENKSYEVNEYIGETEDLYLPLGKYEITVYNYDDPSIAIIETFKINAGIDYLNNPIQLKLKLKEAREEAEPFKFDVTKVTKDSFTLAWNNVSKITGFEITATNWDGSYHSSESGLIGNNVLEFTLGNLNANLIYSINFLTNYKHDLEFSYYFNVKTDGEDAKAAKVKFEEDKLHEEIAKELGIYFRDVTEADMKDLTSLSLDYNEIKSLEGIQYAHNLSSFNSYGNKIADITRLKDLLKLYSLSLVNNDISNIESLAKLSELEYLGLHGNNISDVSVLEDLTKLNNLDLGWNEISNIDPLVNLTELEYLYLYDNKISDISALNELTNLRHLYLQGNSIMDILALKNLNKLSLLSLDSNEILNIDALTNLSDLKELYLSNNKISDISSLRNLTKLRDLTLSSNQISNIDALANLSELQNLSLSNNEVSDLSALSGLNNLRELYLSDNHITDISGLVGLDSLEELSLDGNEITDISALKELPRLQYLDLYGMEITETHMETIRYLLNEGVYVDYYYYDEDEDEDLDEEDIVIDREEVLKTFPKDKGFIVSQDGKSITLNLNKEKVELTPEQTRMLIENNQTLDVQKDGVHTSIPASSFDNYDGEPVTIEINELESDPNSLSSTYDFTIKQGTRTISQFDEGITLTFNVNADRAKNPKNLKVFYFNEETQKWENVGGTYSSNGTVTVAVYHFSKYAVFEAEDEDSDDVVDLEDEKKEDEISSGTKPGGSTNNNPGTENTNNGNTGNDKTNTDTDINVEKTEDKNAQGKNEVKEESKKSNGLPSTATNVYNLMTIGLLLTLIGIAVYFINRRRTYVK